jgi:hypothetical protein
LLEGDSKGLEVDGVEKKGLCLVRMGISWKGWELIGAKEVKMRIRFKR